MPIPWGLDRPLPLPSPNKLLATVRAVGRHVRAAIDEAREARTQGDRLRRRAARLDWLREAILEGHRALPSRGSDLRSIRHLASGAHTLHLRIQPTAASSLLLRRYYLRRLPASLRRQEVSFAEEHPTFCRERDVYLAWQADVRIHLDHQEAQIRALLSSLQRHHLPRS